MLNFLFRCYFKEGANETVDVVAEEETVATSGASYATVGQPAPYLHEPSPIERVSAKRLSEVLYKLRYGSF